MAMAACSMNFNVNNKYTHKFKDNRKNIGEVKCNMCVK